MAKGWCTISSVNDIPKTTEYKGNSDFHRLMSKTPKRDEEALKKHNEDSYEKQENEDVKLLDAFTKKKLKSKAAIRRAKALTKKKKSDADKKDKKAVNPQVNSTVEGQPDILSSRANAEA